MVERLTSLEPRKEITFRAIIPASQIHEHHANREAAEVYWFKNHARGTNIHSIHLEMWNLDGFIGFWEKLKESGANIVITIEKPARETDPLDPYKDIPKEF